MLTCDVAAARADAVIAVAHFDADGVPAAVFLAAGWITEVVLLAQLVGDVGGRRIEVARVPHDFGAAAAVVGHFAQRRDVHAIVVAALPRPSAAACPATATTAADRRLRPARTSSAPAAASRKGKWDRHGPRRRLRPHRRFAPAIDADRVHQHLTVANLRLDLANARRA